MNILFVASECTPFAKTGGLADVVGGLSQALAKSTFSKMDAPRDVVVLIPKYSQVSSSPNAFEELSGRMLIPVGDSVEEAKVHRLKVLPPQWTATSGKGKKQKFPLKNLRVYMIEKNKYFGREGYYQNANKDYPDNDERFIFFNRAAIEFCKFINFVPQIVHCHDWQTGLIPAYLKTVYQYDAFFHSTATVFTVHNIAYQGVFPRESLFLSGLSWHDFVPEKLEYYGGFSFLKAGLVYADKLTTVSPTYANEIQESAEFGRGMEGVLKNRTDDLYGIINGLGYEEWDPQNDVHLVSTYSLAAKNVAAKKAVNKEQLQKELSLPVNSQKPLFGMVSRLDPQKGHIKLAELLPKILQYGMDFQWVILGSGSPEIELMLKDLMKRYPDVVRFVAGFRNELAHRIYAGSDMFFMPSDFEPCGLGQMISMRYGSIPVVTKTGGLADTVVPWNGVKGQGNGFLSKNHTNASLIDALKQVWDLYLKPEEWKNIVSNAMSENFSWDRSAVQYHHLYLQTLVKLKFIP